MPGVYILTSGHQLRSPLVMRAFGNCLLNAIVVRAEAGIHPSHASELFTLLGRFFYEVRILRILVNISLLRTDLNEQAHVLGHVLGHDRLRGSLR